MRSIAEELPHPTKANLSLWDATRDSGTLYGKRGKPEEKDAVDDIKIFPPGGDSDYVVFTQRIGVSRVSSRRCMYRPIFDYTSTDPEHGHLVLLDVV
jgi:N-acetylated-alpha-linked acidic dipeptidase